MNATLDRALEAALKEPVAMSDSELGWWHPEDLIELDPTRPADHELCSEDPAWWH